MDTEKQTYDFVDEQTKKVPITKKSRVKTLVWVIILAAVFGCVAAVVFFALSSGLEKRKQDQQPDVSLSEDEEELSAEPEESEEEAPAEPVVITETVSMDPEEYLDLQRQLIETAKESLDSVVSVTGVKSSTDWFDNSYESNGLESGILIAETEDQFLIVSESRVLSGADEIRVTFVDGSTAVATLQAADANTGLAALSVEKKDLTESTLARVKKIELGSSSGLAIGDPVYAVGSPYGQPFSLVSGAISSVTGEVSTYDANYRLIGTDITASADAGGALVNEKGRLIGIITHSNGLDGSSTALNVVGISELRTLIERLTNGKEMPYLGVQISTVTEDIMKQYRVPVGVYVTDVALDSPAMLAGLQAGDVITKMNDSDMSTVEFFEIWMLNADPDQSVQITVQRMGADDIYHEVVLDATLGVLD